MQMKRLLLCIARYDYAADALRVVHSLGSPGAVSAVGACLREVLRRLSYPLHVITFPGVAWNGELLHLGILS